MVLNKNAVEIGEVVWSADSLAALPRVQGTRQRGGHVGTEPGLDTLDRNGSLCGPWGSEQFPLQWEQFKALSASVHGEKMLRLFSSCNRSLSSLSRQRLAFKHVFSDPHVFPLEIKSP